MHLLHVHDRLSVRGGADIHLLAIASRQAAEHRVSLAVGRVESDASPPPGVELHLTPGLGGRERGSDAAARRLGELVDRLRPDLVHIHNVLQPAVMQAAAHCAPAVATVQDHRSFCPGRGRLLPDGTPCGAAPSAQACAACLDDPDYASMITDLTRRRAQALRGFSRVVVLSDYMRGELVSAGLDPRRLRVVPPFPWSPAAPDPPAANLPLAPLVLASGRLVWAKGFHLLLEAWAMARPALPLVIAGDGPARAALEAQATQLGLDRRRVHFAGWLPRPGVEGLLGRARLVVMPSLWAEPFGIAGLEAQARGVPVAAFDVGGVRDWLRPEHGWLTPAADVAALAQALGEASLPGVAQRRGALAASFAATHFDPELCMALLASTYEEALAEPPLRS